MQQTLLENAIEKIDGLRCVKETAESHSIQGELVKLEPHCSLLKATASHLNKVHDPGVKANTNRKHCPTHGKHQVYT